MSGEIEQARTYLGTDYAIEDTRPGQDLHFKWFIVFSMRPGRGRFFVDINVKTRMIS
jgi:hypothetical protein